MENYCFDVDPEIGFGFKIQFGILTLCLLVMSVQSVGLFANRFQV